MTPRQLTPALLALVALAAPRVATAQGDDGRLRAAVHRYVTGHQHEIVDELRGLLAIPNVAVDTANVRRNASRIRDMVARRGLEARILETAGNPLVFGELRSPGASYTLLVYAHYDGQPVDTAAWVGSGPFQPVLRAGRLDRSPAIIPWPATGQPYDPEWRVYARSASDDKAPIVAILQALDALKAAGARPSVNLKVLFEGEEEASSPHLADALRRYRDVLRADAAVVADGPVYPSGAPTVAFGARGITGAELTVYGATRPLHSGHYGNWAPNPAERLAELLAAMQDSTGRVTIPGWYADVVPPGPAERAALDALAALPQNESERRELGIASPEAGGKSRWAAVMEPSLNVDGFRSGYVGAEARTIIPDSAVANLDFRLVPNVRPADQVRRFVDFVKAQGYFVVEDSADLATRLAHPKLARIRAEEGYPAVRTPLDDPTARALIAALRGVAGDRLVVIPTMGGSVPGYVFPEILGATYIGLPIVNPDNNQHAENENLRLGNLFDGVELFAAMLRMRPPAHASP